jgi:hypothetical protein
VVAATVDDAGNRADLNRAGASTVFDILSSLTKHGNGIA